MFFDAMTKPIIKITFIAIKLLNFPKIRARKARNKKPNSDLFSIGRLMMRYANIIADSPLPAIKKSSIRP